MAHIFISYQRNDQQFVIELENRIRQNNLDVWTDRHIQPGQDWEHSIDEAIKNSFALVAVITPQARLSEYVTYEWSFAMGLGIPIVPLLLEQAELHPKLQRIQYIDFSIRYGEPWGKLIERLKLLSETYKPPVIQEKLDDAIISLIDELKNGDEENQVAAAKALGDMRSSDSVAYLVHALESEFESVRVAAIEALGKIADEGALPYILRTINRKSASRVVREAAIFSLASFPRKEVINTLLGLVPDYTNISLNALSQIQSKLQEPDLEVVKKISDLLIVRFEKMANWLNEASMIVQMEERIARLHEVKAEFDYLKYEWHLAIKLVLDHTDASQNEFVRLFQYLDEITKDGIQENTRIHQKVLSIANRFQPSVGKSVDAIILLDLTESKGGIYWLVIENSTLQIVERPPGKKSDITITTHYRLLFELMDRHTKPLQAILHGMITVSPPDNGYKFFEMFGIE